MKKRIVTQGTLDSLPSIISGVQQYTETNLENLLKVFVETPGIVCRLKDGGIDASDHGLELYCLTTTIGQVQPGYVLTPDYQWLQTSTATIPGLVDGEYVVLKYKDENVAGSVTNGLDGFVYPSGVDAFYKTIDASYTVTGITPADWDSSTELLIGVFNWEGSPGYATEDLRISGVLQLRDKVISELYAAADRNDIKFSGLVGASGIYIGNNVKIVSDGTEPAYTITASGFKEALVVSSGIAYNGTYNRDDGEGTRTVVDEQHILPAHSAGTSGLAELEALFRDGVIDYDDGWGVREVQAYAIPVQPNPPTDLSKTIYSHIPDSEFRSDIEAAGLTFNVAQAERSKILLGRGYVTDLQNKIVDYMISSPAATVSGCYVDYRDGGTYSVAASGIWTSVTGIVTGGYSFGSTYDTITATQLGWDDAGNQDTRTLSDVVSVNSQYIGLLLSNDTDGSIQSSVDQKDDEVETAAASLINQNNKTRIFPDKAQKSFTCRLEWVAPTLVNNQKIKNYEVKVMQVKGSGAEDKLIKELLETYPEQVKGEYRHHTTPDFKTKDKNSRYLDDERNPVVVEEASDFPNKLVFVSGVNTAFVTAQDKIKIGSSYSRVKSFDFEGPATASSGLVTVYLTISGGTDDAAEFITETTDDDSIYGVYGTTYSFDVVPDHYYMAYARSVNIYDYASAWTSGLYIDVRAATPDNETLTIQNIVDAESQRLAKARVIELKALSLETEKQLTSLEQAIAALPKTGEYVNLVTAINQIANSGITGFVPYGS